jgi:hypothetical protein
MTKFVYASANGRYFERAALVRARFACRLVLPLERLASEADLARRAGVGFFMPSSFMRVDSWAHAQPNDPEFQAFPSPPRVG